MNDEVKQRVREIQINRTIGKVRLADLVDCSMFFDFVFFIFFYFCKVYQFVFVAAESIFNLFGLSRPNGTSSNDVTIIPNDTQPQISDDEKEPKVLISDRNEEMLWCDVSSKRKYSKKFLPKIKCI